MERMSSLDAVFIAVEDAVNHMHIGSVGIFEGPAPSYGEVRALVAAKLRAKPDHTRGSSALGITRQSQVSPSFA